MTTPLDDNLETENPKDSESGIDTTQLGGEELATGAEMGNARLGGQEGLGTLQVVRGNNREVVEISGTWRSKDHGDADDGALKRLYDAFEAGETVEYEGPLDDPESSEKRVKLKVEFSSSNRYDYDTEEDHEAQETERRVFNFRPVEGEKALDG